MRSVGNCGDGQQREIHEQRAAIPHSPVQAEAVAWHGKPIDGENAKRWRALAPSLRSLIRANRERSNDDD